MSTRDSQKHVGEFDGILISSDLVLVMTDTVLDEPSECHNRPREPSYTVVLFEAVRVKIRVGNKAIYFVIGMRAADHRKDFGLRIERNEGRSSGCA